MAFTYTQEKFSNAVRLLAVGPGAINERLIDACREICRIEPGRDMPDGELKDDIVELLARVTRVQGGEHGAIAATIEKMSPDEAVEIAELIVALDYQLESMQVGD